MQDNDMGVPCIHLSDPFNGILRGLGYLPDRSESISESALMEAIRCFQQDYQLPPGSAVDEITHERARQLVRSLHHNLNLVLRLQLPLSGIYSSATITAIKLFQQQYGLQVTGIATAAVRHQLDEAVKYQMRSRFQHLQCQFATDSMLSAFG